MQGNGGPTAGDDATDSEVLATDAAFLESTFNALPDIVYAFDRSGTFLRWNDRFLEVSGYTDEEMRSLEPLAFIPPEDHELVASAIQRVFSDRAVVTVESRFVTASGAELPYEFTGAPIVEGDDVVGLTGVGRDVADRKRREDLLKRLNSLNTVIRSVDRALVEENTRDGITTAVCNRLVEDETYCGAVVGSFDADGRFDVDVAAGIDRDSAAVFVPDRQDGPVSLFAAAAESRSVRSLDPFAEVAPDAWQSSASIHGYERVAAVPLVADEHVFGVLAVCSDRDGDFSERELSILEELGRTVGNAVQSVLAQQLLYASVVTRIELHSTDPDLVLVELTDEVECALTLEHVVAADGSPVFYATTSGAPPERIRAHAADHSGIASVQLVGGSDPVFEFRVTGGSMASALTNQGARPTGGAVDHGEYRLAAELPPDVDVRSVVDTVSESYPDTELAARQEVDRSPQLPIDFHRAFTEKLTEKQRTALETAYFAGYFEWPAREKNAQEVAETLGVASQTFHQHLRVATRKLLSLLLEPDGDRDV